jgi:hypothetical protein
MEQFIRATHQMEHLIESEALTFSIKKIACERSTEVTVSFPLVSDSAIGESGDKRTEATIMKSFPVFNNDEQYYTPCFLLDADRPKVLKNLNSYFQCHVNKITEMSEEKE